MKFNKSWFDINMRSHLTGWHIKERSFYNDNTDEYLDRVEIRKGDIGSDIEFYSSGMLQILVYNFKTRDEPMNIAIDSDNEKEKKEVFDQLFKILGIQK